MMQSAGYAWEGLLHALKHERNLKLYLAGFACVLLLATYVGCLSWEWIAIILCGGLFLCTELLNTALERVCDALCHAHAIGEETKKHIKWSKDTASAASLCALVINGIVLAIVFWPYAMMVLA